MCAHILITHLKKLLDSDWIKKGVQISCSTRVNLTHKCKFETPVQMTMKISEVSTKTLVNTDSNPRYF